MSFQFLGPSGGKPVFTLSLKMVYVNSVNKYFDAATGAAMAEISLLPGTFQMLDGAGNPGASAGATSKNAWSTPQ